MTLLLLVEQNCQFTQQASRKFTYQVCLNNKFIAFRNQIITTCALTRDYRNLLERLAVCVESNEPVLLNGETGIGKTKIIQQLARYVNVDLQVVNMSLDSDAADLIGG